MTICVNCFDSIWQLGDFLCENDERLSRSFNTISKSVS